MENYVIFVDAGADISADLCQKYDIRGVPMEYLLADKPGVFRPEDPERDAHCAAFYDALRHGASISTSQITPFAFESCFEPELAAGHDVLYCCFSSGMSATWQNVQATVMELNEKYKLEDQLAKQAKAPEAAGGSASGNADDTAEGGDVDDEQEKGPESENGDVDKEMLGEVQPESSETTEA